MTESPIFLDNPKHLAINDRDWSRLYPDLVESIRTPEIGTTTREYRAGFLDQTLTWDVRVNKSSRKGSDKIHYYPQIKLSAWNQSTLIIDTLNNFVEDRKPIVTYPKSMKGAPIHIWTTAKRDIVGELATYTGPNLFQKRQQAELISLCYLQIQDGELDIADIPAKIEELKELKATTEYSDLPELTDDMMAGMFDGDYGAINITPYLDSSGHENYYLKIAFRSDSQQILEAIQEKYSPAVALQGRPSEPRIKSGSQNMALVMTNSNAISFLEAMGDRTYLRRPQILLALDFLRTQEIFESHHLETTQGGYYEQDDPSYARWKKGIRDTYRNLMNALNSNYNSASFFRDIS